MKRTSPPSKPKKVLVLGSGGLKIGQAGEFDYSGSQALKALRGEGIRTVLVNPNIATVQTSRGIADTLYFLPIAPAFVKKVIEKERPDGILLSFGGQTALNCGISLEKQGVFKKHRVRVLGTPVKSILDTEDRERFKRALAQIKVKTPKSYAVTTLAAAKKAAGKIGFPLIIRAGFALGGKGSGIVRSPKQFSDLAAKAFSSVPQILVEECLAGWKEVEYEVVRDSYDNCITVCNMENFDPMGIHTGESIVVAPSQTLSNKEYHFLREISLKVIRHLGVVGECNIQFALDPESEDYRVIEVNARLSRSSALASKATGYPLAFIAAKLALGKGLIELENTVTRSTKALFEPALDYVVVKVPRWDMEKFTRVSTRIGSSMKSVGEVMGIGREFEEALQKAVRMLEIGVDGVVPGRMRFDSLEKELKNPSDKRLFALGHALSKGWSVERISRLSGIDPWFLYKLRNLVRFERALKRGLNPALLRRAKELGFSDARIEELSKKKNLRALRKKWKITPFVRSIDTLGAEFPAKTNYLYMTYNAQKHDVGFGKKKSALVLGSGAYRIGSSVEFDWCAVNTVTGLKRHGYQTLMLNFNPETVSTDYDTCDRLFFEEITLERVLDIVDLEHPNGVVVSVGGQTPNNLAGLLDKHGVKVLGTHPRMIDRSENRHRFHALCDELGIEQPPWKELTRTRDALAFAKKVGYPVLVRPSYVLSGAAMRVAFNGQDLEAFLKRAAEVSKDKPVVVSKFITGAKEIEIDAVAQRGRLVCWAISEHVENAGVHSGDATLVLPPQRTYLQTVRRIKHAARALAQGLKISGPFNVQFLAQRNKINVIECNLRASRSFPFVSKVSGTNFIHHGVDSMLGKARPGTFSSSLELDYVGVKAPQFSFARLQGADPVLSVEMASTGEVACLGHDLYDAFLKSILAAGMKLPKKNVLLSVGGEQNRYALLETARRLKRGGFRLFATQDTHAFLKNQGIKSTLLYKVHEKKTPNILSYLRTQKLDLAVLIPDQVSPKELEDEYHIRRLAVDFSIPLITNIQLAKTLVLAVLNRKKEELEIEPWHRYIEGK